MKIKTINKGDVLEGRESENKPDEEGILLHIK